MTFLSRSSGVLFLWNSRVFFYIFMEEQCCDIPMEEHCYNIPMEEQCCDIPMEELRCDIPVEEQSFLFLSNSRVLYFYGSVVL